MKKGYIFTVNGNNSNKIDKCIVQDEKIKEAIEKAREDAKKAIMSAELSLKTIFNEGDVANLNLDRGAIKIDERFKDYRDEEDRNIDSLLNPHAISWILSTEYINNNVDPNLGNNLARRMSTFRNMLKNVERVNNVIVYNSIFYITSLLWMDQFLYNIIYNMFNDKKLNITRIPHSEINQNYVIRTLIDNAQRGLPIFKKIIFPDGDNKFTRKYEILKEKEVILRTTLDSNENDIFNNNLRLNDYLENVRKLGTNNYKDLLKKFIKRKIVNPYEKIYQLTDTTKGLAAEFYEIYKSYNTLINSGDTPSNNKLIFDNIYNLNKIREKIKFNIPYAIQYIYDKSCIVNIKENLQVLLKHENRFIRNITREYTGENSVRLELTFNNDKNIEYLIKNSLSAIMINETILVGKNENDNYLSIKNDIFEKIINSTGNYGCHRKIIKKINLNLQNKDNLLNINL